MKFLPFPTDEEGNHFDAGEVFETCVSWVRNTNLKAQLQVIRPIIETEAADYNTKGVDKTLYLKQPHNKVGAVSINNLVKVYTGRMVPKKSTGRTIYDQIMAVAPHRRCPFCGIGTANTLDHYLPKKKFPVFSVTPNNLVPACEWCQGEKDDYYSTTEGGQILHPYYDNVDSEVWLAAEVVEGDPAGFRYFSSPPDQWAEPLKERLAAHLKELKLHDLFSSNAGSRLSEIRGRLASLHQGGGAEEVRAHLSEELASVEADHRNSWVAAMYRAAIASDWFCDGGFQRVG